MSASRDLETGPTAHHLLFLGAPMVIGIAAVMSMSLVDAFFIGRLAADPLAGAFTDDGAVAGEVAAYPRIAILSLRRPANRADAVEPGWHGAVELLHSH